MSGPWERYGAPTAPTAQDGPWAKFGAAPVPAVPTAAPAPDQQPQGFWGTVADQAGKAAQAADDIVRLTANGMTLGYADKLAAYGNGDSVADERAKSQAATDRAGIPGQIAEIGAMLAPSGLIGKAAAGVGGALEAAPIIGRVLANPYAQAAATGAATGAVDATGHDQGAGTGAALGAAGGVVGQGVAAGLGKVAGAFTKPVSVPTTEDVKAAGRVAYKAADDAGVIVNPGATSRLGGLIRQDMADFGYQPTMQPKGQGVLSALEQMDGQNSTLKGLDTLRQVAGRMREGDPSEAELGRRIVNRIDAFTGSLAPSDLVTGDMKAGVAALNDARSLWQRARKSEDLDEAVEKARLRAASTGSGGNVDNATRQNVRRLLESRDNWTPDERQAMLDVIKGTPTQNALRLVGKLSPQGNGLMAALGIGATMANPAMGAVGLAGLGSKAAADAMTQANVGSLSRLLRSGGYAAALQAPPNALQQLTQAKGDTLARLLMSAGLLEFLPAGAQ